MSHTLELLESLDLLNHRIDTFQVSYGSIWKIWRATVAKSSLCPPSDCCRHYGLATGVINVHVGHVWALSRDQNIIIKKSLAVISTNTPYIHSNNGVPPCFKTGCCDSTISALDHIGNGSFYKDGKDYRNWIGHVWFDGW